MPIRFESAVAMAAPATSSPNPKMKTGSKIRLSTPPSIMPKPAWLAWPSLRRRCANVMPSIVGTPPRPTTQKR